jgi:hypothetical protein
VHQAVTERAFDVYEDRGFASFQLVALSYGKPGTVWFELDLRLAAEDGSSLPGSSVRPAVEPPAHVRLFPGSRGGLS